MENKTLVNRLIVFCLSLCLSPVLFAADLANGKALSAQCSACHGKDGLSRDPEAPNLAGLSALYIEKSLVDYQKGARHDRRMSLIAQGLKKSQIKDLSAWYSAFELTAKEPDI
ncbi:MAG TPA: cytochrome C554 [Gammaproteobacteria bacterium]|nr:cytochrome C554 [Gammaproteobacteria bacterium]